MQPNTPKTNPIGPVAEEPNYGFYTEPPQPNAASYFGSSGPAENAISKTRAAPSNGPPGGVIADIRPSDEVKPGSFNSSEESSLSTPDDDSLNPSKTVVVEVPQQAALDLSNFNMIRFGALVLLAMIVVGTGVFFLTAHTSKKNSLDSQSTAQSQNILAAPNSLSIHLNRNTFIDGGKQLRATGSVSLQNEADSSKAFVIQRASGTNLFTVDTANGRVGIGTAPTGTAALQVSGDISTNGSIVATGGNIILNANGLTIGNTLVCTANGCISSTSAVPPTPTLDVANVALLNKSQIITGANTFNNSGNSFTGNGAGLSALNAANISSGTLNDSRLSINVPLLGANNSFTGNNNFSSLNATNLYQNNNTVCDSSGNCSISSTSLSDSGNLARLDADQTFTGHNLFQSATNSTTAFQIQNAAGTSHLFEADTINSRVAIAQPTASYTLDVGGDINSTTAIRVGGNLVCDSTGCTTASGSGFYIQNGTALQTGNYAIQGNNPSDIVALIKGASGQNASLLSLVNGDSGNTVVSIANSGAAVFKNDANSTSALQIQNAAGTSNLFIADTINTRIAIGQASAAYTLDVVGDINSSGVYRIGGTQISSANLSNDNNLAKLNGTGPQIFTGNNMFTGTVLAQNSADSTTAFQIQNAAGTSLLNVDTSNSNIALGQATSGALAAWQTNANSLPQARRYPGYVSANGYTYIIGGDVGGVAQTTVYYSKNNSDGSLASWNTSANSLPSARSTGASSIYNGYVYFIGGSDGAGARQSTVYYAKLNADGSTGSWATNPNALPQTLNGISAVSYNGYVYVFGGHNGTSPQSTVYYAKLNADGSTGTWVTSTNSLPQGVWVTSAVTANGYAYVVGGNNSVGFVSTVYYAKFNADGSVGAWSTNANPLPQALSAVSTAVASGYIYTIGGGAAASTVYYAKLNSNGSTNPWNTNVNALTSGRYAAAGLANNGFVYVIGGADSGNSAQPTVYYTSVNGITRNSGQESIADQLTVGNGLTLTGNVSLQALTDSNSIFSLQNATGGSLINVDSTNSIITLNGNNTGALGSWQTGSNSLTAALLNSASASGNGYIYELGGYNAGAQTAVYYSKVNADGSVGLWSTNANALPVATYNASAVVSGGYIYEIGGCAPNCGATSSTIYYAKLNTDGSTGAWIANTNNLPNSRYGHSSVVANGYMYVVGGNGLPLGSGGNTTVYYAKLNADGSTSAWQTNANALPAADANAGATTLNGYLYLVGGCVAGTCGAGDNAVYYAKLNTDGTTGSWITSSNSLPGNRFLGTTTSIGDYIYQIGGYSAIFGTGQSTIFYARGNADGTTGPWATDVNALPSGRGATTVATVNGYAYIIGGANDYATTPTTSVYYASGSKIQVGSNLDLVGLQGGDGSAGGSITAGNITAVGALQVQGQGSFAQGLSANGNLTIGGSALFQNSANSTTAFQVQNSTGSTALGVNTANNRVSVGTVGTATGQLYVSGQVPAVAVGTVSVGAGASPTAVYIQGSYAYVTMWTSNSLGVYDISNPASPALVGSVSTGTNPHSVYVQSHYAYVANYGSNSLGVYDISNPASPALVGSVSTGAGTSPYSVYVQGSYAYIANFGSNNISIYDVSKPANPLFIGSVNTGGSTGPSYIYTQGKYAYVTLYYTGVLAVYDISNPASPALVGSVSTGAGTSPTDIYVQGRYAYVANTWPNTFGIYDISNPASPALVGSVSTGGTGYTESIYVQGRYAYVGDTGTGNLGIYDISNPSSPSSIGVISDGPGSGSGPASIFIQGRYAYSASGTNNLKIYDLGGAYVQQLEAGGAQFGTLAVNSNATFANDETVAGGLQVGQGAQVSGNLSAGGSLFIQGSTSLAGGIQGGLAVLALSTPSAPTVTPKGTAGSASYSYAVTAISASGGETLASPSGSTATGNATLSSTNYNQVGWAAVSGAVNYKVYRTTSGGTPSSIGLVGATSATIFNDTGIAASGSTPSVNTTGNFSVTGNALFKPSTDNTTAFQVQNASGTSLFTVDTSGLTITLGPASSTPVVLVLGTKNTSGDPTCTSGGIYYNSNSSQFRGCANGAYNNLGGTNIVATIPTTNLYDGRTVQLRVSSSPYEFLTMTYDATYGKWVSNATPLSAAAGRGGNGSVGGSNTYTSMDYTFISLPVSSFYDLYQAGLRPQFNNEFYANPNTSGVAMKFRADYETRKATGGGNTGIINGVDSETTGTNADYYVVQTGWEQPTFIAPATGEKIVVHYDGYNIGTPVSNQYLLNVTTLVRWVSQ